MKFNERIKSIVLETICLLFVLLFVYASISKLLDFENFRIQLGQSPLLSSFAGIVVWLVPLIELLIALLLFLKSYRLVGLFSAFSLMIMFTAYIFIILNYSSFIPCSCGGILEKMGWTEHLIFNVIFVLLTLLGIIIVEKSTSIKSIKWSRLVYFGVFTTVIVCTGIVILFFNLSQEISNKRNNFIRRFPGNATKVNEINLKFSSYYFAGATDKSIYLGNYTAPLLVTKLDSVLKNKTEFIIKPNRVNYPFQSVQVRVLSSNFYLIDGSVPIIYMGKIDDWKAYVKWKGSTTFSHYQLMDSTTVAVRSNNTSSGESELGTLKFDVNAKISFNTNLLQKQIDGIFDVDGSLHFDIKSQKLVYIYLYRNQFIVANRYLDLDYRGKTIDTVSKAQIRVSTVKTRNEMKLSAPPLVVNKSSSVYKNLLFVNSALLGKYEPQEMWNEASIIDIYNIDSNSYEGSFYVYNIQKSKLKIFLVINDNFYGFIGEYLVHYKLSKTMLKAYKK
ncbi:MauE/DoxX family redox-associated membrane protein [Flavobacterium frigidarium]|uniref:MauE/DoxX family redox-associated membrane protein n=1 Tax=Flavobacterium frigidarium TaxID=99286 RepID=A0ABV4KER0_9FLAO